MTGKVYEFKTNNKKQVFQEADFIRQSVLAFNASSPDYKIDKLVLASNKLSSLYAGEDTVFVSFRKVDDKGYKDVGFVLQGADELTVEIHKAQAQKALETVKPLLDDITQSHILTFKPLVELETSKFFKKNVAREIYNARTYNNHVPLEISWNSQKDFFESQTYDFQVEKLRNRVAKINENVVPLKKS